MKYLLLLLLMTEFHFAAKAQQNLVPNPSFEDTVYCPFGTNQIDACQHWLNFGNSPDYFNACTPFYGVPNQSFGYQYAHSGNAMAGLATFLKAGTPSGPNYREFIGIALTQPLNIGIKYYISFYTNFSYINGIATDKIGLQLSTVQFDSCCKPPINNSAHLFTDSLLTDTVSWVHITGSLVADSAYQFLMIGNFFDDANTDTMMFDQDEGGYYYVDDVCVSTDSLFNQTWTSIPEVLINAQFNVFPNPFTSQLKICSTDIINELYVFDMLGNSISTMIGLNSRNVIYSANELGVTVNGIYLVSVQTSNGQKTYLKVFYLNQ